MLKEGPNRRWFLEEKKIRNSKLSQEEKTELKELSILNKNNLEQERIKDLLSIQKQYGPLRKSELEELRILQEGGKQEYANLASQAINAEENGNTMPELDKKILEMYKKKSSEQQIYQFRLKAMEEDIKWGANYKDSSPSATYSGFLFDQKHQLPPRFKDNSNVLSEKDRFSRVNKDEFMDRPPAPITESSTDVWSQ